jgi:DNA replicative helicase MCM subunit Mcm2 (Cdc46/Mcm family)
MDALMKQYKSMKYYIAKHLDFKIWLMTDLVFNSILDIEYSGSMMRGALDVFFLGDTQVGKSETTSLMTKLYEFGHFLSLKTSTTVGLIGGSNKVDGAFCNTIGAIPRQHKRLIVLEEFSGAKDDFISTMTDIRSSNMLRLTRAAGELRVPCKVRTITISNPRNDNQGAPRFLSSFTNGVTPIMELVKAAEDVTRYDAFLLIPTKEGKKEDPNKEILTDIKIEREAYLHHIQWSTSRKAEDVIYNPGVESYIWSKGEELNNIFKCNFPMFGVTTSKKLARFAVALAALVVSTDETYTKVVVTEEIVNYIVDFLKGIYDNETFRLKEYAEEYMAQTQTDDETIERLEKMYAKNSIMLKYLFDNNRINRSGLRTVSGLTVDDFNTIFSQLVEHRFVRLDGDTIYTTERYRKTYSRMQRNFTTNTGEMIVRGLRG